MRSTTILSRFVIATGLMSIGLNAFSPNVAHAQEQHWDGTGTPNNGVIEGGAGTWDDNTQNWTNDSGKVNTDWKDSQNNTAVFGRTAAGGIVTLSGDHNVGGLTFEKNGYILQGDSLQLTKSETEIRVDAGVSAKIDTTIEGNSNRELVKRGAGAVVLSKDNNYRGGTDVRDGTLKLEGAGTLGAVTGSTTVSGGTLDLGTTTQQQNSLAVNAGTVKTGTMVVNTATISDTGTIAKDATIGTETDRATLVKQTGGTMAGTVNTEDYDQTDGTMAGTVNTEDYALSKGIVAGTINAKDRVTISGSGSVYASATINADTKIRQTGGVMGGTANTLDYDLSDGKVSGTINAKNSITISGGGAVFGSATINADTKIRQTNGVMAGTANTLDYELSKGIVAGTVNAKDSVTISGSGSVYESGKINATNKIDQSGGVMGGTANTKLYELSGNGVISGTVGTDENADGVIDTDTIVMSDGTVSDKGKINAATKIEQSGGEMAGTANTKLYDLSGQDSVISGTVGTDENADGVIDTDTIVMSDGTVSDKGKINAATKIDQSGGKMGGTANTKDYVLSGDGIVSGKVNATNVVTISDDAEVESTGTIKADVKISQSGGTMGGTANTKDYELTGNGTVADTGTIIASTSITQKSGTMEGTAKTPLYNLGGGTLSGKIIGGVNVNQSDGTVSSSAEVNTQNYNLSGGNVFGTVNAGSLKQTGGNVFSKFVNAKNYDLSKDGKLYGTVTGDTVTIRDQGEVLGSGVLKTTGTITQSGGTMGGSSKSTSYLLSGGSIVDGDKIVTTAFGQTGGKVEAGQVQAVINAKAIGGTISSLSPAGINVSNAGQGVHIWTKAGGAINASGTAITARETTADINIETGDNVSGAAGIDANTTSGGNVRVVTNGDVRAKSGAAISAGSTGGDGNVMIRTQNTVVGSTYGILATTQATKNGAIDIQTEGVVSGATGIKASAGASEQGSGNINIVANGDVEGKSGAAIEATSLSGGITINAHKQVGGGSHGILATTQLNSRGAIGIQTAGTVWGATGISAKTNGGGDVSIAAKGEVYGTSGVAISAESIGGNVTINAQNTVVGTSYGVLAATLNSAAIDIQTEGVVSGATGISAQATGKGDISIVANGAVQGKTGAAIEAGTSGGNVTIKAKNEIWGGSHGILAVTQTGGVGIETAAVVSGATGIRASAATGDVGVVAHGVVQGTSGAAISASSTEGRVSIIGGQDIRGGSHGILATTLNGAINVQTAGAVSGDTGIDANLTGKGDVSIVANGTVQGRTGAAISASSTEGRVSIIGEQEIRGGSHGVIAATQNGAIGIQTVGAVSGGTGISANSTGTGDISIIARGTVQGKSGAAISAGSAGGLVQIHAEDQIVGGSHGVLAATQTGAISIANQKAVLGATGISAYATGAGEVYILSDGSVQGTSGAAISAGSAGGNVTISGVGAIQGGSHGVLVKSQNGNVSVKTGNTISGDTAVALETTGNGAMELDLGGAVAAKDTAVSFKGVTTTSHALLDNEVRAGQTALRSDTAGIVTFDNYSTIGALPANFSANASTLAAPANFTLLDNVAGQAVLNNNAGGRMEGVLSSGAGAQTLVNNMTGGIWNVGNSGISTLLGSNDVIQNSGTITATGNTTFDGLEKFENNAGGNLSLVNKKAEDHLTISGDYIGQAGSNISLDVDFDNAKADYVTLGGVLVGDTNLRLNALTTGQNPDTAFGKTILLIDVPEDNVQGTVTTTGLPSGGVVEYNLRRQDVSSGGSSRTQYVISSGIDGTAASGVVSGFVAAQNVIASSFFKPSSGLISAPVDPDKNQFGLAPWMRTNGGLSTITTRGTITQPDGSTVNTPAEIETSYYGYQVGLDGGFFNIQDTDANINFGVTGGQIFGKSDQKHYSNTTDFKSIFYGGYAAYTKGPFFFDVQVRQELMDYKITVNDPIFKIGGADVDGERTSVTASTSYTFAHKDWAFIPAAGFTYSNSSTDDLIIPRNILLNQNEAAVHFADVESLIGFGGITVSRNFFFKDDRVRFSPFLTVTGYHDFAGDIDATLTLDPNSKRPVVFPVKTDRLETYGEASLGFNLLALTGKINGVERLVIGSVRGDVQFGEDIVGGSLTAQFRMQF